MSEINNNTPIYNDIGDAYAAFKVHLNQLCIFSLFIGENRRFEQDILFISGEVDKRPLEEMCLLKAGNENDALQSFEFFKCLKKFILTTSDENYLHRAYKILSNEIDENIYNLSKLPKEQSYKYYVRDLVLAYAIGDCNYRLHLILQHEKMEKGEIFYFDTHTFINTVKEYFFWIKQEIDKAFKQELPAAIESVFTDEAKEAEFMGYLIDKGIIKNGMDAPKFSKQFIAGIIARFEDEEYYFKYNTNWNEITHYVFQKLKIPNPGTRVNKNASKDYQTGYLFAKGHFGEIKIK